MIFRSASMSRYTSADGFLTVLGAILPLLTRFCTLFRAPLAQESGGHADNPIKRDLATSTPDEIGNMEREVAEVALKVIPVVLGAVVPLIRILSHFGGRRSKLREEYEFARDYLTDLQDSVTKDSAFLKQKGCLAITGSPSVHFETLERLLHLADPSKAIRNYTFSYKLLEPHNDRET